MITEITKLNFEDFKKIYNKYIANRSKPKKEHMNKVLYAFNDAGLLISLEIKEVIYVGIFKTENELFERYGNNEQLNYSIFPKSRKGGNERWLHKQQLIL